MIASSRNRCFELEKYVYPPGASPTCNTFTYDADTQTMVGCEVFDVTCYNVCSGNRWENWYAARVTGRV